MSTVKDDLKDQILAVRRKRGDAFEKREQILRIIERSLAGKAKFLKHGDRGYLHYHAEGAVVPIDPDTTLLQIKFREEYGLLPSESLTQEIVEALHLKAITHGRPVELQQFAYFNLASGVLYLDLLAGLMVVMRPGGLPEICCNGDDEVLFITDDRREPLALGDRGKPPRMLSTDPGLPLQALLEGLEFVDGPLSSTEQGVLLMIWTLGLFFPQLFPTKLILALVGPAGSGKTTALRRIGKLLIGPGFNVTPLASSSKDFDAALTNESLVILDNLDTRGAPWLADRLCTAATGGTIKVRALYKDNVLVGYPIIASLGITARTPDDVRREDVADRLLLLHVGRRTANLPEAELIRRAGERRLPFFSVVIHYLQMIVNELAKGRGSYSGAFRAADFAGFALAAGKVLGHGEKVLDILDRAAQAQTQFASEHDVLIELLDLWLGNEDNVGRPVYARELLPDLVKLLPESSARPPELRDSNALGRKLQAMSNVLARRYGMPPTSGRGGTNRYTFSRMP